ARRSAEDRVENSALGIHRHKKSPVVHTRAVLPALAFPGIVTHFSGTWHGIELPYFLSGARIVSARVAGRSCGRLFGNICAEEEKILINGGRGIVGDDNIHLPFLSESKNGFAGECADRHQSSTRREKDSRRKLSISGPIGHTTTRGIPTLDVVVPDFLAGI